MNAIDDDLLSNVHNLKVRVLVFVAILVNGLINFFVIADPVQKVLSSSFGILAAVVWGGGFHVTDICHDNVLVVAFAFDKEDLDAMLRANVVDPFPTLLGRIGGIQNCNDASGTEPSEHVSYSSLCCCTALPLALGIVGVKEVCGGLWRIVAPIVADVECLRRYGQPLQVALSCDRLLAGQNFQEKEKEPPCR